MSNELLSLNDVSTGYGEVGIVQNLSLKADAGAVTALIGGNGAGKTTLMLMLAGLLPATGGRLMFDGTDITSRPSHERVDAGMVLVPEGRRVFPTLSVEENLRLGAIAPRARRSWRSKLDEMYALFPRLQERRTQSAGTLSGGEQQMLAIARGLMSRPKLLLLDEPTLGLAPIMALFVFDTIRRLNSDGLTILIAEQDTRHVLKAANYGYVVENGRIAMSGTGEELMANPQVREAYLGL